MLSRSFQRDDIMGKKPTGYARQKIIVQHKTWVPFDEWIYQRNEANYRYADAVRSNIGYALVQQKQQERHKAFVENAKKHNIPIPKKKKEPWEDWPTIKQQSSAAQHE